MTAEARRRQSDAAAARCRRSRQRAADGRGPGRGSPSGRGAYALAGASSELVRAVELCGVVAHGSAAALHGLPLWRPRSTLEITIPRNSRARAAGVRVHRADLHGGDREAFRPVTSVERTLIDCGRTMHVVDALVVLDGAVRDSPVTRQFLARAAAQASGPGASALRHVVSYVHRLAGPPWESVLGIGLTLLDAEVRRQVTPPGRRAANALSA